MKYIQFNVENDVIKCIVSHDINNIIPKNEFPLKFLVYPVNSKKIACQMDLQAGMYATWSPFRDYNVKILTNSGILLNEYKYHYSLENNIQIYEFWDYFIKLNPNTTGLILGCGNGTWGEWVQPIINSNVKVHLVEGSKLEYEYLIENVTNINCECYNELITIDGGEYSFYHAKNGGVNSLNHDYIKKFNLDDDFHSVEIRQTTKFSDLLLRIGHVDWLRFDLEGIDYELIMSLPSEFYTNKKMIQWEHYGVDDNLRKTVDDMFLNLGFEKIIFNIDTIYYKNNG
jgi:hypothetical protein